MVKTKKYKKNRKNKTVKNKSTRIKITSNFESGNIVFKNQVNNFINLEIKKEPYYKPVKENLEIGFILKHLI